MESLNDGITTPHTVRIPDPLWDKLTTWAAASGVGDSEALRYLLRIGLDNPPALVIRPPRAWMKTPPTPHVCEGRRRTDGCGGKCSSAWRAYPRDWYLAQIPAGSDWWDLDALLGKIPGVVRATGVRGRELGWVAVPATSLGSLRSVFEGRANRLLLHGLA